MNETLMMKRHPLTRAVYSGKYDTQLPNVTEADVVNRRKGRTFKAESNFSCVANGLVEVAGQASRPTDASSKKIVLVFAIGKMTVQAFHLLGSNARCVSPSDCHEAKQCNFQISNTWTKILLTIFWNHGIRRIYSNCWSIRLCHAWSIVCHSWFEVQHVETIFARQVFENHL